jgi:hypothetical protein
MKQQRHTADVVEIRMAGDRVLHVGLHRGPDADAEPVLLLALAWADQGFHFDRDALRLPATAIPQLQAALAELAP